MPSYGIASFVIFRITDVINRLFVGGCQTLVSVHMVHHFAVFLLFQTVRNIFFTDKLINNRFENNIEILYKKIFLLVGIYLDLSGCIKKSIAKIP